LIAWLEEQGCPRIGLWGISLGAWLSGLLAREDARLDCGGANVTGIADGSRDCGAGFLRAHSPQSRWVRGEARPIELANAN